ncbi:pilus assembly protein [Spongiibacter tropicus]|uniref:pilus assembly protein n=1 Tax=Spongiibacter tropicus TaxID=454602 RepID=UPI0035BE85CA
MKADDVIANPVPRVHSEKCNIFIALGLFLCALLIPTGQAFAQDSCTIEVTSSSAVGEAFEERTYTFDTLSEINNIIDIDVDDGGYPVNCRRECFLFFCRTVCDSESYQCQPKHYRYAGNILTVDNPAQENKKQCKATFTVEGHEAGCVEPGGPEAGGLSQVPLFLAQTAEPNVMYILDDSGSMHFEVMPDSLIFSTARYVFPRAEEVYGSGDYDNRVVDVDFDSDYNAIARSPQHNKVYYDPGTYYRPWIKADGSYYPQASTSCALHNPEREGTGIQYCRNLTAINGNINDNNDSDDTLWVDRNCGNNGCSTTTTRSDKSFWPSVYFWYSGDDPWDRNDYARVRIHPDEAPFEGHGRERREDCANRANASCSYSEEIQNFANWYTYYRSRVLAARAGSGFAFATQGSNMRVGFATLNKGSSSVDGVNTEKIVTGVRAFEGDARTSFYNNLYSRDIPNAGTPLRRALDAAGKYFQRDDDRGPWSETPGEDEDNADEEHLECRRNYSVLVSDGYWSGSDVSGSAGNDNDSTDGPSHEHPVREDYSFVARSPFSDSRSDTLADVAMYYWKTDLRSDLENLLNQSPENPAFWQHMTTFTVGFGVVGTIDPQNAFDAIGDDSITITWPNPTSAEVNKIDDMLHAAVNSRGDFFSASEPEVFADELSGVLLEISQESKASASSIAANSTRLDSGTLIYQASFNTEDWSGRLQAYEINDDGTVGDIFWDTNTSGIPAHGARNLISTVGSFNATSTNAVAFTVANWDQLSANQRSSLRDDGTVPYGQDTLSWLRGDQSNEGSVFRERQRILGDIVNSDPLFVGNSENYGFSLLPGSEGSSYGAYLTAKAARQSMIYVGANDGMLHGFNASTGAEVFGFIPLSVYPKLPELADPEYSHLYFVDGSAQALDAYIGGSWKTILVGSTSAGADSVFAIDVTNPGSLTHSSFMWEFATASDASDKLGYSVSQPVIARLAAGNKWVAIFGNGYGSGDTLKLFVVDLANGALLKAIDTEVSGAGNTLAPPVAVDANDDRIADYVYAGDMAGNMWKFDLSGASSNDWGVAFVDASGDPAPLFVAVDESGATQPVTAKPTVGDHPDGGLMVYFGTGKYFETNDSYVPESPQILDFYGIRDNGARVTDKADLLSQSIIYQGTGSLSDGSTTAASIRVVSAEGADAEPPSHGWHLQLLRPSSLGEGERAVSPPILRNGRIIFTSIIPTDNICGFGGSSWLMEVDAVTGGRYPSEVLDINGDEVVDELDRVLVGGAYLPVSGIGTDELIKTPGIIDAGDIEYKYTSGSSGSITRFVEPGSGAARFGRQSWRQLR